MDTAIITALIAAIAAVTGSAISAISNIFSQRNIQSDIEIYKESEGKLSLYSRLTLYSRINKRLIGSSAKRILTTILSILLFFALFLIVFLVLYTFIEMIAPKPTSKDAVIDETWKWIVTWAVVLLGFGVNIYLSERRGKQIRILNRLPTISGKSEDELIREIVDLSMEENTSLLEAVDKVNKKYEASKAHSEQQYPPEK